MWRLTIVYKMPRRNAVHVEEFQDLGDIKFALSGLVASIGGANILEISILPNVKQGSHHGYVQPT